MPDSLTYEREKMIKLHDEICKHWTKYHGGNSSTSVSEMVGEMFSMIITAGEPTSSKLFKNKVGMPKEVIEADALDAK